MKTANSPTLSPKVRSISRRFSYAFIGVVTLILLVFAGTAIFVDSGRINAELEKRLDNALKLSYISLPAPLWNLDNDIVDDFIEALFLDESIVFAEVVWGGQIISKRVREKFQQKDALFFSQSSQFIMKISDILYEGNKVGTIRLAMSRESVKKELIVTILGITALTILIIAAIALLSLVITKRYISSPLLKLQESASLIAHGDLDTFVDKSSNDEVRILGQNLDAMRGSIKQLFTELSESKVKLEEYSRNLEQKVELRTQELERSVQEYQAEAGTIIVLDPRTFDVLAMASWPSYSPEKYFELTGRETPPLVDPAVSHQYEPGSVFKILTAAAALDSGMVSLNTHYYDQGWIEVGGQVIRNATGQEYGDQMVSDLLLEDRE